ncbi:MAG: hypothetical protein ABEK59_07395 [Halobacteria archaeon]
MEFLFFPRLSRRIEHFPGAKRSTHTANLIYTIARSVAHPVNYPGSPNKVPGLACGVSWVSIAYLRKLTGRRWETIKRNLQRGVDFGFWRSAEVGNGYVKFSLRAPHKVAEILGMESVGGFSFVPVEDFPDLHLIATELVAEGYQRATFEAARCEANRAKTTLYSPDTLVNPKSLRPGSLDLCGSRWVLLTEQTQTYGISQKRIAELLGKSEVTVRKHLSHGYRRRRGLRPIQKRQQALPTELTPADLEIARSKKGIGLIEQNRHFVTEGRVYRAFTNIYVPAYQHRGFNPSKQKFRKGERDHGQQPKVRLSSGLQEEQTKRACKASGTSRRALRRAKQK